MQSGAAVPEAPGSDSSDRAADVISTSLGTWEQVGTPPWGEGGGVPCAAKCRGAYGRFAISSFARW